MECNGLEHEGPMVYAAGCFGGPAHGMYCKTKGLGSSLSGTLKVLGGPGHPVVVALISKCRVSGPSFWVQLQYHHLETRNTPKIMALIQNVEGLRVARFG